MQENNVFSYNSTMWSPDDRNTSIKLPQAFINKESKLTRRSSQTWHTIQTTVTEELHTKQVPLLLMLFFSKQLIQSEFTVYTYNPH